MYELKVERVFSAAHAIMISGQREPVHGHNWRVRLVVAAATLDSDGVVCDFHQLERELDRVIGPWHNRTLNDIAPFDRANPTAEHIAHHIAQALEPHLPQYVHIARVSVTEAPGCEATYFAAP